MNENNETLRVLFVEDEPFEAEIAAHHLRREGVALDYRRVQTEPDLREALAEYAPHLILSDFSLPGFDGLGALRVAREVAADVPFIFLSGTIGEERAIGALRSGAVDYILKGKLARLAPAVRRALAEAEMQREQRRQAAQTQRLNGVLQMLSGINGLALRIRDRVELLSEACDCAVRVGGYTAALALLPAPEGAGLQVAARSTTASSPGSVAALEAALCATDGPGRTLRDRALAGTAAGEQDGERLVLPLTVDRTPIGVFALCSDDATPVSAEELALLRELAGNLSFGLQYLETDDRMRFLSHFDVLTGLARRPLFCQRVQRRIDAAGRERRRFVVAVIDIEKLGDINASFGRRTGDLLLQHVADRLRGRFSDTEEIAHFDGGTFALVRDITRLPVHGAEALLQGIQQHATALFGTPFELEGRQIPVSARAGLALYPEDGHDGSALVDCAERALQDARNDGQRHFHYRADRHSEAVARLELEHRLHDALARHEFELHYQPKVNVVSRRIEGLEALLRWNDPTRGLVAPAAFLPVLESSALFVDVGRWVIAQAARDCRAWSEAGLPPTRVAVNVAPAQLREADFLEEFLAHLDRCGGAGWGLDVEITESALHDDCAEEIHKLAVLRGHGVKVAIDDFGTGYSSLHRLATLPVDTLKIDRSFVGKLGTPAGSTLVRIIIAMARAFRMNTVGEGVENSAQLEVLRQLGCDQSQGFLHARPQGRQAVAEFLSRGDGALLLPSKARPEPRDGVA